MPGGDIESVIMFRYLRVALLGSGKTYEATKKVALVPLVK